MIQCSSLVFLKTLTRTPVTGVIVMESLFHRVHLPLSGVTGCINYMCVRGSTLHFSVCCFSVWGGMVCCIITEWLTATCVCASPWQQVSSSSEPSSGSTCCSSPEWSSTPEQCTQSYSSEGKHSSLSPIKLGRLGSTFTGTQCVTGSFCRSPERCRLSRAGEHAGIDLHCGQHLCSRWTCGLSCGHSQIDP